MERINLERRRLIQPRKEMKRLENKVLFQDFNRTIATVLFEENTYPWEILPKIHDFIMEVGMLLPKDEYDEIKEHVWVAKTATVAPTAYINGPAIIGPEAEVRHCAFIRGNAIVGEGAVVGNSTELKMLFYLIKYRFLITIMLVILSLVINHIWSWFYHF